MDIKAVLFDCDGLMFDTEIIAQAIWREGAREYGVSLPDNFFEKITGAGGKDLLDYIRSVPGAEELMKISRARRFDLNFWGSIHTDCLNRPGLIELFQWLNENGYRIAICSSSARQYVETLCKGVSVELQYDAIVCGDMVTHAKPDPEIFLRGAELLGAKPEECMVLEDSKQGILAASRAGMHRCFIPDTIVPDEEMKKEIEFEAGDLNEVITLLKKLKAGDDHVESD